MVVLQKMQNSIFSTLALVCHFQVYGVCVLDTDSVFCVLTYSWERTNMFLAAKWLCITAKYP